MTVTVQAPALIAPSTYRIDFSSSLSDPTFRVYHAGRLIHKGRAAFVRVASESTPFVEVLDDDAEPAQALFPWFIRLRWTASPGAAYYSVRREVSGQFTEVARVREDGRFVYEHRTPTLGDLASETYRVVPVTASGDEGEAVEFAGTIVRIPDAPEVSLGYAGGEVVIADA